MNLAYFPWGSVPGAPMRSRVIIHFCNHRYGHWLVMWGVPITTDPVRSKRPPQDAHNAGCNKDEKTPNKQRKVVHLCRMGDRSYNWWESERYRGEIFAKEHISGFSRNSSFSGLKGEGGKKIIWRVCVGEVELFRDQKILQQVFQAIIWEK